MKKNIIFSRITASLMSAVMTLSLLTAASASVSAEDSSKVYQYDGYSVEYTVRNEWTGNQSVEIILKNTGTETITGWAMKYDANGEISNLWNGEVYKHDGENYIIKCRSYNSDIAPGRTVSFGYNVSGDSLDAPASFENCMKRVDVSVKDFTAVLVPSQSWNDGFSGNIELSNLSDSDITSWELSFTASFSVDDVWNAKLLSRNENKYVLSSNETTMTIFPDGKANIGIRGRNTDGGVPSISDVSLSRVVIDEEFSNPDEPENPDNPDNPDEPVLSDETLFAYGEYDASSDSIILYWMKSVEDAASDVYVSGNSKDFTHVTSLVDEITYRYDASNHLPDLFFKIAQKDADGKRIESNVVHMKYDNGGYILLFEDSDEDCLPDLIEDNLGTDKNNADTDKDGLTDYEEYAIIGTEPTKYDTDGNGINDADEDLDNDGLSNRVELDVKTNPLSADTDSDGLLDGEEGRYGCDPLKYDTDSDSICDGDEVKIGLDPINPSTHGVPDNQYTFEQVIPSDSEVFSGINTPENPYRISVELTAAGYAPNSISAGESGYSAVMRNDAILGISPELSYTNGCKIDDVVLKFEIDQSAQANVLGTYTGMSEEFSGIKRLNVFKYFDDINMLLPIETFHDTATGTVYTHVDELGTYCLMDMEVWLDSIGIEPEESLLTDAEDYSDILLQDETEDVRKGNDVLLMSEEQLVSGNDTVLNPGQNEVMSGSEPIEIDGDFYTYLSTTPVPGMDYITDSVIASGIDNAVMLTDDPGSTFPTNKKEDIKVVFVVNVSAYQTADKDNNGKRDYLETIKENIYQASRRIFAESPNATVYIMENRSYPDNVRQYYEVDVPLIDSDTGETRKQTIEKNSKLMGTCSSAQGVKSALNSIYEPYQTGYVYDPISLEDTYIELEKMNLSARDGVYIFDYTCLNDVTYVMNATSSIILTREKIIDKGYDMSAISYKSDIWHGIHGYMADQTGGILVYEYEGSYHPVLNHIYGYVPEVRLQAILATGLRTVFLKENPKPGSLVDTDEDGIPDSQEIDFESGLIKYDDTGITKLPTFAKCRSLKGSSLFYVEQGLTRFWTYMPASEFQERLDNTPILPITSDPMNVDGDEDGLLDAQSIEYNGKNIAPKDPNPLKIDGPKGMWKKHIDTAQDITIPTANEKWYGDFQPTIQMDNNGAEGFLSFAIELSCLEQRGDIILNPAEKLLLAYMGSQCADFTILGLNDMGKNVEDNYLINTAKTCFNYSMMLIQKGIQPSANEDRILASLGSRLLNFKADKRDVIHSQYNTWQSIGGYNNKYDKVFREYTNYNMRNEKFPFTITINDYPDYDFILWLWRGDYLNIGAGAEIGIYYRPSILSSNPDKLDQYFTYEELAMPMQLYLYNYESSSDIENIYSWRPDEKQWWITGFNPKHLRAEVDVKKQIMIGCVDFTGREFMYEAFIDDIYDDNHELLDFLIFDKENKTVWILWGERKLIL